MISSSVIPYPARASRGNKLLARDKVDVCTWEALVGALPQISRIVIHCSEPGDPDQFDFVLVYGPNSQWARWGLARREAAIALWQCSNGVELGVFETMQEALAVLQSHAMRTPELRKSARKRRNPPPAAQMEVNNVGACD